MTKVIKKIIHVLFILLMRRKKLKKYLKLFKNTLFKSGSVPVPDRRPVGRSHSWDSDRWARRDPGPAIRAHIMKAAPYRCGHVGHVLHAATYNGFSPLGTPFLPFIQLLPLSIICSSGSRICGGHELSSTDFFKLLSW